MEWDESTCAYPFESTKWYIHRITLYASVIVAEADRAVDTERNKI